MGAMATPAHESRSDESIVRTRRAPKYGIFAALGAMAGIIAALILSTVFNGSDEASRYTQIEYSTTQVFGFVLLWCVPAGIAVAMLIALLLDRTVGRKTREVRVVHEITEDPDA